MTYVEFLNYVIENVENTEAVEIAKARLEREIKAQGTRKAYAEKKTAEKKAAKAEIFEKVYAVLTDEPKTATTLVEEAGVDITRQAIPPLFKAFGEGKVAKVEIKLEGAKGKQVGYVKA